ADRLVVDEIGQIGQQPRLTCQRPVVEVVGDPPPQLLLALLLAHADVRLRVPEREKELRRRIADHLHDRALAGETRMLVDLADLVDNKAIRWGFGAEGSVDYRVD